MRALLRIEPLHAVPHAQESLLHEVFGNAGVAHHAEDETVREPAVAIVELGERLRLAALEANDESRVRFGGAQRQQDG